MVTPCQISDLVSKSIGLKILQKTRPRFCLSALKFIQYRQNQIRNTMVKNK